MLKLLIALTIGETGEDFPIPEEEDVSPKRRQREEANLLPPPPPSSPSDSSSDSEEGDSPAEKLQREEKENLSKEVDEEENLSPLSIDDEAGEK